MCSLFDAVTYGYLTDKSPSLFPSWPSLSATMSSRPGSFAEKRNVQVCELYPAGGLGAGQVRTTAFPAASTSSGTQAALEDVSPEELRDAVVRAPC